MPKTKAQKTVQLINGLRLIQAGAERWGIEQSKPGNDVPLPAELEPYFINEPTGWELNPHNLDEIDTLFTDPRGYIRSVVYFNRSVHFIPSWRDPFGNPYILSDLEGGAVAIHPRSLHLCKSLSGLNLALDVRFLPFDQNPEFKRNQQIDILASAYRAAVAGQAEKLRTLLAAAHGPDPDHQLTGAPDALPRAPITAKVRSVEARRAELQARLLPDALAETSSIRDSAAHFLQTTANPESRKFYEEQIQRYDEVVRILGKAVDPATVSPPENE